LHFPLDKRGRCGILKVRKEGNEMTEIRFSYEPFKKEFLHCPTSHATALYNIGKQKDFDQYIRGIIQDNVLYLRTFYPFDDIEDLSGVELRQKSRTLLEQYQEAVLKVIGKEYNTTIKEISFNAENDLLTGLGLANI
jgi:hypothetical protein